MSPLLPPELVEKVLIIAVDECRAKKKDLLSVCLASKQFFDIAFPFLHVRRSLRAMQKASKDNKKLVEDRWKEMKKPSVAPFVTSLRLIPSWLRSFDDFRALRALEIYYAEGQYPANNCSSLADLSSLTHLSLSISPSTTSPISFAELLNSLSSHPTITHLSIEGSGDLWEEPDEPPQASLPSSLTSFHVRDLFGEQGVTGVLEQACTSTTALQLEHLTLRHLPVSTVSRIVAAHASSLLTLSFSLENPSFNAPPPDYDFLYNPSLHLTDRRLSLEVESGGMDAFWNALVGMIPKGGQGRRKLCCDSFNIAGVHDWDAEDCSRSLIGLSGGAAEQVEVRRQIKASSRPIQEFWVETMTPIFLGDALKNHSYVKTLWPSFPPIGTEELLRQGKALRRDLKDGSTR